LSYQLLQPYFDKDKGVPSFDEWLRSHNLQLDDDTAQGDEVTYEEAIEIGRRVMELDTPKSK
jgi:hypothetical protein